MQQTKHEWHEIDPGALWVRIGRKRVDFRVELVDPKARVKGHVAIHGAGAPCVTDLRVSKTEFGVTSLMLRKISTGKIAAAAQAWVAADKSRLAEVVPHEIAASKAHREERQPIIERLQSEAPPSLDLRPSKTTGGPTRYSEDFFREIAEDYLAVAATGDTRTIALQLAQVRDQPVERIRDWVRRARKKGYLTAGRRGRGGAGAGPALMEWRRLHCSDEPTGHRDSP